MRRSSYSVSVKDDIIAIVDENGMKSVTNDIENVLKDLSKSYKLTDHKIIYQDSMGIWDEVLVNTNQEFDGFSSLNAEDLNTAVDKLKYLNE